MNISQGPKAQHKQSNIEHIKHWTGPVPTYLQNPALQKVSHSEGAISLGLLRNQKRSQVRKTLSISTKTRTVGTQATSQATANRSLQQALEKFGTIVGSGPLKFVSYSEEHQ